MLNKKIENKTSISLVCLLISEVQKEKLWSNTILLSFFENREDFAFVSTVTEENLNGFWFYCRNQFL